MVMRTSWPRPGTLVGMSSLPLPVRVAAGLVVTAVEEVRDLPRTVIGFPITAVSRVLQLSMRAQQLVTELAIKGDTALEGGRPVEEAPSWARFDEEGSGSRRHGLRSVDTSPYDRAGDEAWDATVEDTSLEFGDLGPTHAPSSAGTRAGSGINGQHAELPEVPEPALGVPEDTTSITPDALPGYETLTLAALRGHLASLDVDELTELLAWESAHADRPAFVTLLSNRIATLTAQG